MTLVTHIDSNAFDEGSIQQSHAVQRLLEQLRDLHTGQLDQIQSFSWLRFMFSLVSYTLFFTDVLRSGLGYQETPNQVTLEPDHQVVFGPVGYPILHLTTANATPSYAIPYWPYKYDSTSVPLRATAEYLDVSAWTPCMLYKDKCDETSGVSLHSVFDMIDSLVGAVRDHRPPSSRTSFQRQGHVTLRAKSVVYDRLHDYVFPWIFNEPVEGTVHAIAYKYSKQVGAQHGVCDTSYTRPYSCTKLWTRFSRSCPPQDRGCEEIGTVWSDISRRAAKLQRAYPDKTVEYVVFEVTAGKRPEGLTLQGHETGQLVIFSRIRDCTAGICQTVAVDDYRYEIALITKDTASWYKVVATLRILGQTHVWIRMLALCAASYAARSKETTLQDASIPRKLYVTLRTVFLIPSQVVVYGSLFPIVCYVLAHLIDGRFAHEILSSEYISTLGAVYNFNFERYVRINAIAMRSVWKIHANSIAAVEITSQRLCQRSKRNRPAMALGARGEPKALDDGHSGGPIQQQLGVQRLIDQLRDLPNGELDQIQSFSWIRFIFSLVSYTLFFTDVLRSGLGYQETPNQVRLEPNNQVIFGPVGYPILHLTTANATPSYAIPYWPYKYDSTSVPLRAAAEYLDVSAWTPCMLYKDKCDETSGVSLHSVFAMIDSLVGAVRDHRPPSSQLSSQREGHVTLRVKTVFYDRLHDYVFPWIFNGPLRGTVHAIAYTYSQQRSAQHGVCDTSYTRPYSCSRFWTRFTRSCPPQSKRCVQVGYLWSDINRRAAKLQCAYPNRTVEYVVFEITGSKRTEGLTFQGRETGQLVIFSRIRDCTTGICRTIAVDDYRYEIVLVNKDTKSWYSIVATLRAVGQAYVWIRMLALFAACYTARSNETKLGKASIFKKVFVTLRTVFLIPSQVVVYGSLIPIACYVLAHLIDGRFAQEILATEYISTQGAVYNFNFDRYLRINAIAMRSVWKVAFLCHILVVIHTRRSWTPNRGVLGVPEFFLSLIVAPSIFAQFRILSGRDTRILEIDEIIPCPRQIEIQIASSFSKHNLIGTLVVGGSTIDIKCMLCGFLLLCAVYVVVNMFHYLFSRWQPFRMVMMSRTRTPCTAGTLWHSNALVVSWDGTIVENRAKHHTLAFTVRTLTSHVTLMVHGMVSRRFSALRTQSAMKKPAIGGQQYPNSSTAEERKRLAMIYIMNLAVMSDPVTLFNLRVTSRQQVGVYAMRHSGRCFLLPYPLHELKSNLPIDWRDLSLLTVVAAREFQWWVLLQCE
ncbi:hypothetical protein Poli38472_011404 [Pythium oligandrum]|uniref:Uncharacterized protein n=1 Tax=Pythium oligandrum TaxID=41045 RepID=A0A8K1CJ51_PYTOL|nr:hypothetical protein Poli38472_011404 [Pythium oligandrum]|eukprot:TMW64524.1 hypothetical protein Poli38472_011404 [Pythium oligandrum]